MGLSRMESYRLMWLERLEYARARTEEKLRSQLCVGQRVRFVQPAVVDGGVVLQVWNDAVSVMGYDGHEYTCPLWCVDSEQA